MAAAVIRYTLLSKQSQLTKINCMNKNFLYALGAIIFLPFSKGGGFCAIDWLRKVIF